MAVRDDFGAGEVLAAADLNDTFASKLDYPSGGANGDILTKSGSSAVWGSGGGLTLITTESFTGVSSININDCFSNTYEDYALRVVCNASASVAIRLRMRASGVDDTGNNYNGQLNYASGATSTGIATASGSSLDFMNAGTTQWSYFMGTIHLPYEPSPTGLNGLSSVTISGSLQQRTWAGRHSQSVSYDGLTIFPSGGTFTGTLRIYGYKD